MAGSIYVDESKRRDYLLVAGVVLPSDLKSVRRQIRSLHLPGQRGIHMVKERKDRQNQVLTTICEMQVEVRIMVAPKRGGESQLDARRRCLRAVVDHAAQQGLSDLVLDRDETVVALDRRVITEHLAVLNYRDQLRFAHDKVEQEPLLAIPDAIAWAWPQGGFWRRRCESIVTDLLEL